MGTEAVKRCVLPGYERHVVGVDCCVDTCCCEPDTPTPAPVSDFAGQIDGNGYKGSMDDPKKLPLWLVPISLLRAAARALQYGAKKYAANNWRKGMAYSEVYSALQRHLTAWLEDNAGPDEESGLSHLDHAAACLAFLSEYEAHPKLYGKFDDRFKRPKEANDVTV